MITIHELSAVLSIHLAAKILFPETGMEWTSSRSLERYSFESEVRMLLNIRREKEVRTSMDKSFKIRISPSPSILRKYLRVLNEIINIPIQKKQARCSQNKIAVKVFF